MGSCFLTKIEVEPNEIQTKRAVLQQPFVNEIQMQLF